MPGGFEGERIRNERSYKLKAREALAAVLPAERAAKASREDADALRSAPVWINLLSLFESMRLKETIESPSGPAFLAAATRFAAGEYAAGIAGMAAAMKGHGHLSWPIATYFPSCGIRRGTCSSNPKSPAISQSGPGIRSSTAIPPRYARGV
jgi:hypothetical protein